MLKRLMISGPYTFFMEMNCEMGAISLPLFTLMFFNDSMFARRSGSACTITRYILPKRLKLEA